MRIAVTGHRRASNLGKFANLRGRMREKLVELSPELLISGMAIGVDQIAARVAIEMGIPVWACIPCLGQDSVWSEGMRRQWRQILERCERVTIVTEQAYHPRLMQVRNEFMVDNADEVLAVFDGTPGGTANCIRYATERGVKIHFIRP